MENHNVRRLRPSRIADESSPERMLVGVLALIGFWALVGLAVLLWGLS